MESVTQPEVEEKQGDEVLKELVEEKTQSAPKEEDLKSAEEVKPGEIAKKEDKLDVKAKASNVIFKVQLMASGKDLPLVPENFKGLNLISKESYKTLFRYMYGNTQSHREAQMMKTKAVDKGYKTAYIVAYNEGVRISLTEALRLVSQ